MRTKSTDVPAALPLLALILGLAFAPVLVNPWPTLLGLAFIALLRATLRPRAFLLFAILGIALGLRGIAHEAVQRKAFAQLDAERFITIEAPIDRDWTSRDSALLLRTASFRANEHTFDTPLAIYARFDPPPIEMQATIRAEGFLRLSERGQYTLSIKSAELMSYEGELPRWHPKTWNRALANRLRRHVATHPQEVALAQALVLGRGELLTEEMRESFRRGGTYHLLVFSGLQIAFAAGLLAALLRWLHAPRASDWLLLAFAALAPLFIGSTASVSRASIGIGVYALSRILQRPTSVENLWCLAALLRLLVEPADLTNVSFHLTYAGAGALLFIGKHFHRVIGSLVAAELAITPLTLFHFHQYTLGGSLVTLAMSPLIFAMLILSSLACAFPWFLDPMAALHRACGFLNALGLSGFLAAPPLLAMLCGALAALLALALLKGRTRAIVISCALLLPTAASIQRSRAERDVEHSSVTFFDVGQGDATALRSGEHTMLIDGGRDARLLPLLADRGIRRIDDVVLSHAHPDHCGALPQLIEQFDVGRVWITPRKFTGECAHRLLDACIRSHTPIHFVRDGTILTLGTFTITAHLADTTFRRAPENNASIVLRAETGGRKILLTGDIEKEAELVFGDRDLRSDILKVAHHGSRGSSSDTILDNIAPHIAVISCGRRNLFGHPHPTVLDRLRDRGVRTWRTDRDGTVTLEIREGKVFPR
ncbi:MAG TPA: DNA internalization-related competence protein ComEC/Rec2 [Thermoanaerobaculia bacterium]|nr:DNA internalization-related competence protein ComEC/Rec2 [Thermoanaerobaculia bacterium]